MFDFNLRNKIRESIALRYILIVSTVLIVIQLLYGAYQVFTTYRQEISDLETATSQQADFLAAVTFEHVLTNNFFVLERLARQTNADPNVVYAVILAPDGRALTQYVDGDDPIIAAGLANGAPPTLPDLFVALQGNPLLREKRRAIQSDGAVAGEVWLGYTLEGVRRRLYQDALATLALTLVVIGILAGLANLLLNRFIARPLHEVGALANDLASGNLQRRAAISSQDEIGRLKMAFNSMAEQLESTLAGLQSANQEAASVNTRLRKSEADARQLSQVARRTNNLVIISDANGDVEWVNDAFLRVTGYALDEVVGTRPGQLLQGPQTDQAVVEYMRRSVHNQEPFKCEVLNYAKDGTPYWVAIDAAPVYGDHGELVNFIAVERDITQQKELVRTLQQRVDLDQLIADVSAQFVNCTAREVNDRIEQVLGPLVQRIDAEYAVMALTQDPHQRTLEVKSAWIDASVEEALALIPNQDIDPEDVWCRMLQAGKPLIIEDVVQSKHDPLHVTHSIPQHAFKSLLVMPIFWAGDCRGHLTVATMTEPRSWSREVVAALEVVSDIFASALERMEIDLRLEAERESLQRRTADLNAANSALAEASRTKDAFWASMSHELRTPLNAILGFAQLMARDKAINEQQKQYLDIIQSSGAHLLGLINDVLNIAKIEAGRMTIAPGNFDLFQLLNGLEKTFSERFAKKGLQFAIVRKNNIPQYVHTDEGKLRQVLLNLFDNAIKFTQSGSVILRVAYYESDSRLSFAVEDTGVGIDSEELAQVFELFTQTESGRRSQSGTGLGLAISRQFVEMLGGKLTVVSERGVGTTFSFTVDISLVKSSEIAELNRAVRITSLAPGQPPCRILVVEDQVANRQLLQTILEEIGFELRFAFNGQEGVEQVVAWNPDLVLMDLRMPIMDGYEATKAIRQHNQFKKLPIVAVTASALDFQHTIALDAGCNKVLSKPIQIDELLYTIQQFIDIEYVYDMSEEIADSPQAPTEPQLADSFAKISLDHKHALYTAATRLDTDGLYAQCDELEANYPAAAAGLRTYIDDFDLEAIIALTAPSEDAMETH